MNLTSVHPTRSAAAAAAAVVAIAGGGALIAAWPASAAPSPTVIRLTAAGGGDHDLDLGRKGFSPGDMQVTTATLSSAGERAGRFVASCQATRATKKTETQLCTWVFDLRGGSITTTGTVSSTRRGPAPFNFAITGGTGSYTAAEGYLHVAPANRRPTFELHLQP
jgi:hypothetical protein